MRKRVSFLFFSTPEHVGKSGVSEEIKVRAWWEGCHSRYGEGVKGLVILLYHVVSEVKQQAISFIGHLSGSF